jgi:DNA-binding IclR family transcriptional regulator
MKEPAAGSRKTIDKALRVLTAFSPAQPALSVGELAERLGLHKSIVSRIASSLCAWRILEKDSRTHKLRVGERAYQIGSLYAPRDSLSRIAKPFMEELVAKTGQSSHVSVIEDREILVVSTVESPTALRVIMRLGERRPVHSTAAGKLYLALQPDLLDVVLSRRPTAFTANTITSPAALRKEMARVRQEGIAWNIGENSVGAGAVAAPIFGSEGQLAAALSTVFPLAVVGDAELKKLGRATIAAARSISKELGYSR